MEQSAKSLPVADEEYFYLMALSLIDGIGPKTARILLQHFGNAGDVFKAKPKELQKIEGVGEQRCRLFKLDQVGALAEREWQFANKHQIRILHFLEPDYPRRLRQCDDAPLVLYYRGNRSLNPEKVCAIIGTRRNTDYGQRCCDDLLEQLQGVTDMMIVSGLALGIDTIAHKAALRNQIPTVGVLGHGLDTLYPASNKSLAADMMQHGGLLTEFISQTRLSPQNFPVRNRIVAGMADVTIVVESDVKGGAMITSYVAASYNREIAAFPGRIYDSRSGGTNLLIKKQIASLITGADDLLALMNWGKNARQKAVQQQLFLSLSGEEQAIISLLRDRDAVHTDELMLRSGLGYAVLASVLLQLEMQQLIKVLPGKMYRLQ